MGPLNGIRILDMTSVLMGPFATQFLGDYGAEVIKVEPPEGDVVRQIGPMRHPKMGPLFLNSNRNKRSVVLDLKQAAGRSAFLRIASTVDALVFNVRPLAMQRLGLGFEDLKEVNPRIVYAGLVGFGQSGPYAPRPAYDDLIQGASTLSFLIAKGGDGIPRYVPNALADRVVGLTAVGAILSCIISRDRTGNAQSIEIPMFETLVGFVLADHFGGLTFNPPLDEGGYARQLSTERRPYETRDGYICVIIFTSAQWMRFFDLVDRRDLQSDPRFADIAARTKHVNELYAELRKIFLTKSSAEWLELLEKADIPSMPMHSLISVADDEHLVATQFFSTVEHPTEGSIRNMKVSANWSEAPLEPSRLAPRLGEHSREVLAEAGLASAEIERMFQAGATF